MVFKIIILSIALLPSFIANDSLPRGNMSASFCAGFNSKFPSDLSVNNQRFSQLTGVWKDVLSYITTINSNYNNKHNTSLHRITRIIWSTCKHIPDHIPTHLLNMYNNNSNWKPFIIDDFHATEFINIIYADTGIAWAYTSISTGYGAIKADIFRYAVLYVFGGVYIDLDSVLSASLDQYLKPGDNFILGAEGHVAYSVDQCYTENYTLADTKYNSNTFIDKLPWKSSKIVQSILISKPYHVIFRRVLHNMMTVYNQYCYNKPVFITNIHRQHVVFCSSGPDLLTATIRQVIYQKDMSIYTNTYTNTHMSIRYAGIQYSDLHGQLKVTDDTWSASHWKHYNGQGVPLFNQSYVLK